MDMDKIMILILKKRFHEKEEKWKIFNEAQSEKEDALNIRNASLERTVQKYLREIDTLKNRYGIQWFDFEVNLLFKLFGEMYM